MKKLTLPKFHWAKLISVLFFMLLLGAYANIFAIGSKYAPGATLDPACPPGEVNCTVDIGTGGTMIYPSSGIPVSNGTAWTTSIIDNSSNWNTAYGWGNHATAGYVTGTPWTSQGYITDGNTGWDNSYGFITSYTETDPIFVSSSAHGITGSNISNWNTAYGWGNHATAGYVTGTPWTSQGYITDGNTGWDNSYGFITSYTETDPIFLSSTAHSITGTDVSNWNAKQAALVSGTNIKTINGSSVLGVGDLSVPISQWDNVANGINYAGGKVGIGTTSPVSKLSVYDTSVISGENQLLRMATPTGTAGVTIGYEADGTNAISGIIRSVGDVPLYFSADSTASTKAMTILKSGRIGIGTTSPLYKLSVSGSTVSDVINSDMGFNVSQVLDPTAPSAIAQPGSGLEIGNYWYSVTYYTATGETHSTYIPSAITTTSGNQQVQITIPVSSDPRVLGRKIYRTKVGAFNYLDYYLTTIANNTATVYVDNTADASLVGLPNAAYFRTNTTSQNFTINGVKSLNIDDKMVAIGVGTGSAITNGGRNTLVGAHSAMNLNSGFDNTINGFGINSLTTGSNNTFIGSYAGESNSTGHHNSAFGYSSLGNINGAPGIGFNTAMGSFSGLSITGNANTNVFIGANSGNNALQKVDAVNSIAIGYQTYTTLNNQVVIGNDSIIQTLLKGNIGIGTTTPGTIIEIGSSDLGNGVAGPIITLGRNTNGTATGAGSINFLGKGGTAGYVWQDAAGNMRINTSAPTNANDIAGTVIGAQTSTRDTKTEIMPYTDYAGALAMVTSAPLNTFRYIKEVEGYGTNSPLAKTRIGFIADEVDPTFMVGNVIDQVSVNGLLIASIKELDLKVKDLSSLDTTSATSLGSLIKQFIENEANRFERIFAKTVVTDGLEMKDSSTGEYYCVVITNGEFNKIKGKCGQPEESAAASDEITTAEIPTPTPTVEIIPVIDPPISSDDLPSLFPNENPDAVPVATPEQDNNSNL